MKEKLETLPLAQIRQIARDLGIKNVTSYRKALLIDMILERDEASRQNGLADSRNEASRQNSQSDARNEAAQTENQANGQGEMKPAENQGSSQGYIPNGAVQSGSQNRSQNYNQNYNPNYNQNYAAGGAAQMDRPYGQNGENPRYRTVSNGMQRQRNVQTGGTRYGNMARPAGQSAQQGYNQPQYRGPQNIQQGGPAAAGNNGRTGDYVKNEAVQEPSMVPNINPEELQALDSGIQANGILEVMPDGYGFIRCANFLPGDDDVYVSPSQIRRFNLKTGDIVCGSKRVKTPTEKFAALLYVSKVNDMPPNLAERRPNFEDLTPIFPNERIHLETQGGSVAMRIVDLLAPVGKGQRGMIASQPKAGKTTLLKEIARAVKINHKDMHLIVLLIDERPEEVTDIKESIEGPNVEVIYSTFDELPEHHKRVSEMVLERAKRLVEHGKDVMILLDSITRLARAYNLTVQPSGRTLSGGLDPAALHMPKRFFGAARNMREGGSLTILATALVETGSRLDDMVFEEFKGTGNMELVLNRKLSEKRIFPAIDILKSGTRRDDLLLTKEEQEAVEQIRKVTGGLKQEEAVERILDLFRRTRNNREFLAQVAKIQIP